MARKTLPLCGSGYWRAFRRPWRMVPRVCALAVGVAATANLAGRREKLLPVTIIPGTVAFTGTCAQDVVVSWRNNRIQPIVIERVESSCPCIRAGPLPARLAAGGSATLHISFEPEADDEGFGDLLLVSIRGFSSENAVAFEASAKVDLAAAGPAIPH